MNNRLGHKQTAAMLTLMALGREVTNTELEEIVGFRLDSKERIELNKHGYVTSRKKGRPLAHTITEDGIEWCRGEIGNASPPPPRPRSLIVPAVYVLFTRLNDYLRHEKLDLTEVFVQPTEDLTGPDPELTSAEIENRITAAYRRLAGSSHGQVGLVELRPMLGDIATEKVDAVLKELSKAGQVSLFPESNRKRLTAADHRAAIRIGGEDNHLISIEAS